MAFGLRGALVCALIALIALCGCEEATNLLADALSPEAPVVEATPVEEITIADTPSEPVMDSVDMESMPVKLVLLVDYPLGGKEEYLEWIVSIAPIIRAPEELKRLATYDNVDGSNPHRLVEFEFDSFADSMSYFNRPDVAAVFADLPNHTSSASSHVFVQRSDYAKNESTSRNVKSVYLIDYPLGDKAQYLAEVAAVAPVLQTPDEVKRIAAYDNYYGVSPHRLVELEFDSYAEANAYAELTAIRDVNAELPNRTGRTTVLTFELRSDYVNE